MKNVSEIINENGPKVIDVKTVKLNWDNNFKDLFEYGKEETSKYTDIIKNKIQKNLQDFYMQNPRKLNALKYGKINTQAYLISDSEEFFKLMELYKAVGMDSCIMGECIKISEYSIFGNTRSKKQVDDLDKIDWKKSRILDYSPKPLSKCYNNGYNGLPGEIVEEYRDKLISIIDKTKVEVSYNDYNTSYSIKIYPIYKDSDLKKLFEEIINREDLINYAKKLGNISKSIEKYYNKKKSGEYTGD